jgi:hypothetical protein
MMVSVGEGSILRTGVYDNTVVKVNGAWHFAHRRVIITVPQS